MSDTDLVSSIAAFRDVPDRGAWLTPRAADTLIHTCAGMLFDQCRGDYRRWLSESDLQSLLFAILRHELPTYGIPSCAVHSDYAIRLSDELAESLGRRSHSVPVDLALVVPSSISLLQGRHWQGQVSVGIEVKRGCERYREIQRDLAKLAAVKQELPDVQVYMVLMGLRNQQEAVDRIVHAAEQVAVPLLWDNYWRKELQIAQPELV